MSFLKDICSVLFGNKLEIGDVRVSTRTVRAEGLLLYSNSFVLQGDNPIGATVEVILPTQAADIAAEYIRRTTTHLGATVSYDDDSDDAACKLVIQISNETNTKLVVHFIEAILFHDLAYQCSSVRSISFIKQTPKVDFKRDCVFDLEKVKQFYSQTEEDRRVGNQEIEFQFVHYTCGISGINTIQTITKVSREFLFDYLEMMEKTSSRLSGKSRVMDLRSNKFCLYVFE